MAVLSMNAIDINNFTVSKKSSGEIWLIAEASEFRNGELNQRVYDDACDEGFAIKGKFEVVNFVLNDSIRDKDGDIKVWIYHPLNKYGRIDRNRKVFVHILND